VAAVGIALLSGACSAILGIHDIGAPEDASTGGETGSDAETMEAHADAPPDGSEAAPPADGGDAAKTPDAVATGDGGITPVAMGTVGAKVYATGYGEELHILQAQSTSEYWLFYVDDTAGEIKTRSSPDFVSWTERAALPVNVADGNNFSLAHALLGGVDVVHLVANTSGTSYATRHVRATIASEQITPSDIDIVPDTDDNGAAGSGGGTCPNDAPSVTILPDGHVYDVTAWTGHPNKGTTCDTNVYLSTAVDTGTAWTFGLAHDGYYVSVPSYAYSHELLTLPEAGVALALWPDEDNSAQTQFDSVGWAFSPTFVLDSGAIGTDGTVPVASAELFAGMGTQMSSDDWAACRLSDGDIHVVRHVLNGGAVQSFEEVRWNGSQWLQETAPPQVRSLSNTGVVLLAGSDPTRGMLLGAIGTDNSIQIAKWTAASGWAAVATLPATTTPRQSLAGTGCAGMAPHIIWTEGMGPYTMMAADVSSLL